MQRECIRCTSCSSSHFAFWSLYFYHINPQPRLDAQQVHPVRSRRVRRLQSVGCTGVSDAPRTFEPFSIAAPYLFLTVGTSMNHEHSLFSEDAGEYPILFLDHLTNDDGMSL